MLGIEMTQQSSYLWPEIMARIFSVVAIVISGFSMPEGRWQHQDGRNTEVLGAVYEDWVELANRDDWRVQHLLEAPEMYYLVRDLARRLTAIFNDEEKVCTFLVERATTNNSISPCMVLNGKRLDCSLVADKLPAELWWNLRINWSALIVR